LSQRGGKEKRGKIKFPTEGEEKGEGSQWGGKKGEDQEEFILPKDKKRKIGGHPPKRKATRKNPKGKCRTSLGEKRRGGGEKGHRREKRGTPTFPEEGEEKWEYFPHPLPRKGGKKIEGHFQPSSGRRKKGKKRAKGKKKRERAKASLP